MAKKPGFGQLTLAPPAVADLTKARDERGMLINAPAPAAPPQMSADFIAPINTGIPKPWKPSALAVLDGVLGGMTFTDSIRSEEARHDAEARRPQMEALQSRLLAELGKAGPDELKAYLTNPGEFGKNMATRLAAANVEGGGTRVFGNPAQGGSVFTAPKYQIEDGAGVKLGPDGMEVLGRLPRKPEFQVLKPGEKLYGLPMDGSAPAAASAPAAPPSGAVYDQIRTVGAQLGAPPEALTYLQRLAQVESNGNAMARNGSSTGVFQFHPDTFASVGGGDINSVADQTKAALALALRDRKALTELGIEPTDANTYIMHQQGAGGGKALLTAPPDVNAIAALAPAYGGNMARARQAIVKNGGNPDMTAGEFVGYWRDRWGGGNAPQAAPQGPQPIAEGGPATPTVPAGYRLAANGGLEFIPGGPADPAQKAMTLKFVPSKIQEGYVGNSSSVRQIDEAIAAIEARPQSLGLPRIAGENINQRIDPDGVDARAAVANIGSLLIHDRSGAVVTAAEAPRLMPFIPRITDTPEAAIKKLRQLKAQYQNANSEIEVAYGEDRGYRPVAGQDGPAQAGPAREKGWSKTLPAPQIEMAKKFKGTKAPPGDPANPFVPRSAAEFKNIPSGKSYIDDDGSVQVKR